MCEDIKQYHWSVVSLQIPETKYTRELFKQLSDEFISVDTILCEKIDELYSLKKENERLQQELSELKTFCVLFNKFHHLFIQIDN